MLNRVIILVFCFVIQQNFAQHCSEESTEQVDVNSISSIEKCKVEDNNDTTSSKDFSLNNRYLKRRKNSSKNLLTIITKEDKEHNSVENLELTSIRKNINSLANSIYKTNKEDVISFSEVDHVPVFTNCNGGYEDATNCFNDKMQEHINMNFTYPEAALENKMEGVVLVSFIIDIEGDVTDIKTISSQNNEILKKEAVRIISMLPKFIPGKTNNKNINVLYSFPMEFKIN
ncbi:energy transducer TonB [Tenacibaculum xiamenense]|uniref:energy transducer TonB n=1 Tax=Tenacibaculum xiamenense TaxID=1261553 RepID=UPI0038960E9A